MNIFLPPEPINHSIPRKFQECVKTHKITTAQEMRKDRAEAYAAHAAQANDKARSIMKRADWLKMYLLANMESCGITEISAPGICAKVKTNPPSVDVFDLSQIPEKFMRQPPPPSASPDKKAISSAIKSGEEIPGARLMQSKRLVIE